MLRWLDSQSRQEDLATLFCQLDDLWGLCEDVEHEEQVDNETTVVNNTDEAPKLYDNHVKEPAGAICIDHV